jgi:SET domain-containing protein
MRRLVERHSTIHRRRVISVAQVPSGDYLLEYECDLLSARAANPLSKRGQIEEGYSFFFFLEGGRVIGSTMRANSAP